MALHGLFAETVQNGDLARLASGLELLDAFDPELLVQSLDFFWAETGNRQHGDEPGRHRGLQLVVVPQLPGRDEFGDFLLEGLADSFHLAKPLLRDDFVERLVETLKGSGGVLIGANLERVFALQIEQHPDVHQNGRDLVFVHFRWSSPVSRF